MKKIGVLLLMFCLGLNVIAQEMNLSENIVEPPKFIGNSDVILNNDESRALWSEYLTNKLDKDNLNYESGIVAVLFTITADGNIKNIQVENSVSNKTDKMVVYYITKSKGLWEPGKVNGNAVDMEKEVFVRFSDPNEPSLEKMAQNHIGYALKKYNKAECITNSFLYAQEKEDKVKNRMLKSCLTNLEIATRYQPNEPSIAFWQCKAYELQGNKIKSEEKFLEFNHLIDPLYQASIDFIDISIR